MHNSLLSLNCLYLALNYYVPFLETGGNISVFKVGRRLTETSNSYVRVDKLYEQLLSRGIRTVIRQVFIVVPIEVYDIDNKALKIIAVAPPEPTALFPSCIPIGKETGKKALIYYNGPMASLATKEITDLSGYPTITVSSLKFKLDKTFDSHFLVYTSDT